MDEHCLILHNMWGPLFQDFEPCRNQAAPSTLRSHRDLLSLNSQVPMTIERDKIIGERTQNSVRLKNETCNNMHLPAFHPIAS